MNVFAHQGGLTYLRPSSRYISKSWLLGSKGTHTFQGSWCVVGQLFSRKSMLCLSWTKHAIWLYLSGPLSWHFCYFDRGDDVLWLLPSAFCWKPMRLVVFVICWFATWIFSLEVCFVLYSGLFWVLMFFLLIGMNSLYIRNINLLVLSYLFPAFPSLMSAG